MSGAKANRAYLAIVEEDQWGQTPSTPTMQKVNFTAESLVFNIETTTPDSIRDDRMISDVINVSAGAEGGFEFEFQAVQSGPDDMLLLGALWAEQWTPAAQNPPADIEGATITAATRTIDFNGANGAPADVGIGDLLVIGGSANGNDGPYTVEATPVAGAYIVKEPFVADETLGAGALAMGGQFIENGQFMHSYTIERGLADVGSYFLYKGMVINEMTLTFETGSIVTGGFTFVGKDAEVGTAEFGDSYVNPPTTEFMSAAFNVSNVMLDGAPIPECLLQNIELTINNNVNGKMAVGQFGYCGVSEGEFEPSGSISLYFNDPTMYEKFINSQSFALSFMLTDSAGNMYRFNLPKLKLSADVVNVEGKNTDVVDAAEFFAIYDEDAGYAVRIDRIVMP